MAYRIARYLSAVLFAAVLGSSGMALAQNNPGGPDDKSGTAHNIPSKTGTPGTFNAKSNAATSNGASSNAGSTSSGSNMGKMQNGAAPAGNSDH